LRGPQPRRTCPPELAKCGIWRSGSSSRAYYLLPELDALENVCLPARMARVPAARAGPGTRAAGPGRARGAGGAQTLRAFRAASSNGWHRAARWMNEPALILADEPTGNLDSRTGQEIINLLCAIREEKADHAGDGNPRRPGRRPRPPVHRVGGRPESSVNFIVSRRISPYFCSSISTPAPGRNRKTL